MCFFVSFSGYLFAVTKRTEGVIEKYLGNPFVSLKDEVVNEKQRDGEEEGSCRETERERARAREIVCGGNLSEAAS
jgi:hypothetical protein